MAVGASIGGGLNASGDQALAMDSPQLTESLRETLAIFEDATPLSTPEVADVLDLGRRSTYERLERLVARDCLETKKVGASARVWWRPDVAEIGRSGSKGVETGDGEAVGEGGGRQFDLLVDEVEEYAIFLLDADGCVQTWNAGARRIKGYEASEIVGEHVSTFYTERDVEADVPQRNLERAAESGEIEVTGWRVRADGSRFWATVTISAIHEDGDVQGYAKVTRDMTERREREQRLREEVAFTESILDNQRDLVYAFDADGTPLRWNDQVPATLGYDEAEIGEMSVTEFVADAATERVADALERVLGEGESVTVEAPLVTSDGETIPYEVTATPTMGPDGAPDGFAGIGRDITERRRTERHLERRRDELAAELEEVFERISDGFVGLDEALRFTYVNDRAGTLLDVDDHAVVGRYVTDAVPIGEAFEDALERALADQAVVSRESYYEPLDAWIESTIYPSDSGLSVYFRDVSERKERERELELYETLFEQSRDVNAVLDTEGTFEYVTPSIENVLGYERERLLGENGFDLIHPDDRDAAMAEFSRMVEDPDHEPDVEFRFQRADDSWAVMEVRARNLLDDPEIGGIVVYTREVTERRERERELELYETIVSAINDGVYVLDEAFEFEKVNEAYTAMTGYDRAELLGSHCSMVVDDAVTQESADRLEEILAGETSNATLEADLQRADGTTVRAESNFTGIERADGKHRKVGVVRDVSERVERERELERRVRQQAVVADLGQDALEARDIDDLMADAVALVAEVLDTDYCKVLDLDADADRLHLRQGVGWETGIVGTATVSATAADSQAAYTLSSQEPVVVTDLDAEDRFSGPDLLRDHDVASGISTIVGPIEEPWGILGTHDTDRREFAEQDVAFVQSVATILATAIERREYERRLVHQREQLAALNGLNEVVRQITDAAIEGSTREEIEAAVCEGLAAADSFDFAWVGQVDAASQTVELCAEAGVDGYMDDITISTDPEDEHSNGPTGRALRSNEIEVAQDCQSAADYEPWWEHARAHAVESSAAIPIRHGDTTYGVINVYTERRAAFQGDERAVLAQLGEVVGHAIAAVERKRALMSDEIVELEFQLTDFYEELGLTVDPDGWVSLDEAVPTGDGDYLVYGRTTAQADAVLTDVVSALPHWEGCQVIAERNDHTRFEARLSEPPIISGVASRGGYVERAVVDEHGDFTMSVHLPPGADVRSITDLVQTSYPAAELLAQRQRSNVPGSRVSLERVVHEELTDRQRTVLTAAFQAGFFEWPRENNGEYVADSLGVASPTFHQHLRKAEAAVFGSLLGKSDRAEAD